MMWPPVSALSLSLEGFVDAVNKRTSDLFPSG
jgi:hypothetical protein